MAGSGTTALATDVSIPYSTGFNVMGVGSVSRGYGQTTFGATKNVGDTIGANAVSYTHLTLPTKRIV